MVNFYTQPNFDPRMTTLVWPGNTSTSTPIQRGFMYWDSSVGLPPGYSSAAYVKFLFNPSTVTTQYVLQDSSAQAALNYPNLSNNAALAIPLQQSTEFSLLFDRTYEMWGTSATTFNQEGQTNNTRSDIQLIGVDVDVRAMRQFTGMYASDYTDTGTGNVVNNTGATGVAGSLNQGLMQMVPSYLYFSTPSTGIMYYGYVDSWDVIYTHWTSLMIPMRCEVDVSFTFLPPPLSPASAAGANLIAVEQQGTTISISQSTTNNALTNPKLNAISVIGAPVQGRGR